MRLGSSALRLCLLLKACRTSSRRSKRERTSQQRESVKQEQKPERSWKKKEVMKCKPIKSVVYHSSGVILMARLISESEALATQAAISSVKWYSFDLANPSTVVASGTISKTDVIFDTLQHAMWSEDATGYNFRHVLPASATPTGDRTYRIEYRIVPTGGERYHVVYELESKAILSAGLP